MRNVIIRWIFGLLAMAIGTVAFSQDKAGNLLVNGDGKLGGTPAVFEMKQPAGSAAADVTVTTTFERSGVAVEATAAATLLDTAEAAGVMAPYGCRTGNCHTCSTRLVSGCTTDLRDGRVSDAGTHVQLCVSAPLTDVVLDV